MKTIRFWICLMIMSISLSSTSFGQEEHSQSTSIIIAFLALDKAELVDIEAFKQQLQIIFGEQFSQILSVNSQENTITIHLGKNFCMLALLDYPIPWKDLEWPCSTSWQWREATSRMKKHTAHLVVSIIGDEGTTVERTLTLTKTLAAAAASSENSVGAYWGKSSLVHEPSFLIEEAKSANLQNLPVMLWINFNIQPHPDQSFSIITIGLEAFELMGIEILESTRSLEEMMNMAIGTAWLLLQGENIADGDTVGPDPESGIQVTYEDSVWERPGKVLRIYM